MHQRAIRLPRVDPFRASHVVHDGYTVLLTPRDAQITGGRHGLFDFDTRIVSQYRLTLGGQLPMPLDTRGDGHRWHAHLVAPLPGGTAAGPHLPQDAIEIEIERLVGCGMVEQLVLRNHGGMEVTTELAITVDADFVDLMAIDGREQPPGDTTIDWDAGCRALTLLHHVSYADRTLERGLRVTIAHADSAPHREARTLRFAVHLTPHGMWHATLSFASLVDGRWRDRLGGDGSTMSDRATERERWRRVRAAMESSQALVAGAFERAADDLLALRNWELEPAPDAWIPNAGVPSYTGIFGRDVLTAGWQAALLGPEMMRGALAVLAARQATTQSAWHDAEPGKLLHEARRGPLAELNILPQRAYYGEETAPAMFVVTLSEYWHWTGDTTALAHYRDAALQMFDWAAHYGDRDGDGLLEYVRRSTRGLKNHAWKDSDEAIRYPDGRLVPNPIATIEEQAYYYIALQRMAEMLLVLGDDEGAERFLSTAQRVYECVNDRFWMEDEHYYAIGLDADKHPIRTIASNPGHALAAGIVPPERARMVADRLMAEDLFSGWGVRTLSTAHPSYNPFAYHLGTVWPVENATFALGLKRYGLDEHAERLVDGMFDASAHFEALRLPEALAGHARRPGEAPTFYPQANAPQAWSASAIVQLLQVQLGLIPFAAARLLALVRPRLPPWLPDVMLRRVRVGEAVASLRFHRKDDGSAEHEILEREGSMHVLEVAPPADVRSERTHLLDRIERWGIEHAPGTTARALRIAMGLEGSR
ncbi:MAG TPA: glycogen debranching N-terminal domain-containing protein [Gemmatimonadaceae bacterium]|nr:glycogen debranching N-terminal domain-containing protein [Gemmatimonadaceae bacterium]